MREAPQGWGALGTDGVHTVAQGRVGGHGRVPLPQDVHDVGLPQEGHHLVIVRRGHAAVATAAASTGGASPGSRAARGPGRRDGASSASTPALRVARAATRTLIVTPHLQLMLYHRL